MKRLKFAFETADMFGNEYSYHMTEESITGNNVFTVNKLH